MKIEDILIGFAIGVLSSLAVFYALYKKFSPPEVYVVDFSYLAKEGITKKQIESVLEDNTILIDKRCVLNPNGRDITFQIERALKH
jgi:hypothetical protein